MKTKRKLTQKQLATAVIARLVARRRNVNPKILALTNYQNGLKLLNRALKANDGIEIDRLLEALARIEYGAERGIEEWTQTQI